MSTGQTAKERDLVQQLAPMTEPTDAALSEEQLDQIAGGHSYVLTSVSHSCSDTERES